MPWVTGAAAIALCGPVTAPEPAGLAVVLAAHLAAYASESSW